MSLSLVYSIHSGITLHLVAVKPAHALRELFLLFFGIEISPTIHLMNFDNTCLKPKEI